jgi:hypothetical protein
MIAKLLLTLGLLVGWLYAFNQAGVSRVLRLILYVTVTMGIYFVWFPEHTTELANLIGIGRGTDLVLYLWIILSFIIILNLHLKMKQMLFYLTEVVRFVAISHPVHESFNTNDEAKKQATEHDAN